MEKVCSLWHAKVRWKNRTRMQKEEGLNIDRRLSAADDEKVTLPRIVQEGGRQRSLGKHSPGEIGLGY